MSLKASVRRFHRKTKRVIQSGSLNSGDVVLRWRERTGGATYDPHLRSSQTGAVWTDHNASAKAMIHYVNIHTTGFTKFTEIQQGDIILDFIDDVSIDGKESLVFEIGGVPYVQKNAGEDLAKSWDVRCNGQAITRTVIVTLRK